MSGRRSGKRGVYNTHIQRERECVCVCVNSFNGLGVIEEVCNVRPATTFCLSIFSCARIVG